TECGVRQDIATDNYHFVLESFCGFFRGLVVKEQRAIECTGARIVADHDVPCFFFEAHLDQFSFDLCPCVVSLLHLLGLSLLCCCLPQKYECHQAAYYHSGKHSTSHLFPGVFWIPTHRQRRLPRRRHLDYFGHRCEQRQVRGLHSRGRQHS